MLSYTFGLSPFFTYIIFLIRITAGLYIPALAELPPFSAFFTIMQMTSYVLGITDVKGIDSVWRYHNYAMASSNARMVMMSSSVASIVMSCVYIMDYICFTFYGSVSKNITKYSYRNSLGLYKSIM